MRDASTHEVSIALRRAGFYGQVEGGARFFAREFGAGQALVVGAASQQAPEQVEGEPVDVGIYSVQAPDPLLSLRFSSVQALVDAVHTARHTSLSRRRGIAKDGAPSPLMSAFLVQAGFEIEDPVNDPRYLCTRESHWPAAALLSAPDNGRPDVGLGKPVVLAILGAEEERPFLEIAFPTLLSFLRSVGVEAVGG